MKKYILALSCAMLLSGLALSGADAAERTRIGIAAIVNDDIITLSDLGNRIKLYSAGQQKPPSADERRKMEAQVLSRLIDEKLQLQAAKDLGISIEETQLNDAFAEVARQNGASAEEFRQRLQKSGVRVNALYDQLRADISWAQVVRRKLRPQINVSESEIDNEIDRQGRKVGKPEYQVAEIFLPVKTPGEETGAREEADRLVTQITKGASFAQVAREFSQSPGASAGGDIGWVQEGQLEEKLFTALAKMQPGQISPPLRSDDGFHILFLRDVRTNKSPVLSKTPAETPVATTTASETVYHLKQIVIPLSDKDPLPVANAKTVRAQSLKSEISSCDVMAEKSKDFTSEGTGDLGKVPASKMPEALRPIVEALEVGVLSNPIRFEKGLSVLMVCEKTEAAAAVAETTMPKTTPDASSTTSDEVAREKTATKIGMQRLSQMQERYLRDLRATAYIDKRI